MKSYSRREFIALPVVAYAASLPGLSASERPLQRLEYGEYTRGKRIPYSWDRIKSTLGLKKADEESFYRRFGGRYAEITAAYNKATDAPDFKQLFGLTGTVISRRRQRTFRKCGFATCSAWTAFSAAA